jgi:hypothetical protein
VPIHNGLELCRRLATGSFYEEGAPILATTQADLERRIRAAKLPVEFVQKWVTFEPGLQSYKDEEWVRARALDLLQKADRRIDHVTAEEIYLRLYKLVSESTGQIIERQQVEAIIDAARAESVEVAAQPHATPYQVPRDIPHFVGRGEELAALEVALTAGQAAAVCGLAGLGGIGKSALAAHFASRTRDRFPDGVLYASLRDLEPLAILGVLA